MPKRLFSTKPVGELHEADTANELQRTLDARALVLLGVGAIIGTGIFVLTGTAAANHAGPALVVSFLIAGLGCAFAGLCYAEFASMIPVSGSAYTYAYATLGEFVAWIIGWDLILEYLFAAGTVAVGWSGYVVSLARAARLPPARRAHQRAVHEGRGALRDRAHRRDRQPAGGADHCRDHRALLRVASTSRRASTPSWSRSR